MTQEDDKPLSDNKQLDILADAISDIGYWSWWTEQLPDIFQIEFGGTQLYFPPADSDRPPQTQIAIRFDNVSSINFLSKNKGDSFEWTQHLQEDKMEPPTCSHGKFSFGNSDLSDSLLQQVSAFKTLHGNQPTTNNFLLGPTSLIFWCGDIGLAIAAKEMKVLNHAGDIALADIREINKKW